MSKRMKAVGPPQPSADDRAALALMVIGPDRREKLIDRYANGLALAHGMRLDAARRYAAPFVDEADPYTVLAVGQVWSRPDGKTMPGDVLADMLGREHDEAFTVEGFSADGMVHVGNGRHMNAELFRGLWLTAWPAEFTLDGDESPFVGPVPEPADDTEHQDDGDDDGDEDDRFDPRAMWVLVTRTKDEKSLPFGDGLPLLSAPYRAVNWHKPEYTPSYGNLFDAVALIADRLDDYRASWSAFRDAKRASNELLFYFQEWDDGCECGLRLSAYIGDWLRKTITEDVVAEYGGRPGDYDVLLMWAPGKGDAVLAAAPFADPEWEVPPDHPLALCAGQEQLFSSEGEAA